MNDLGGMFEYGIGILKLSRRRLCGTKGPLILVMRLLPDRQKLVQKSS
jgi:hypothetical protein